MSRWMGSRFQGWIDYNGVTFSLELLKRDCSFSGRSDLEDQKIQVGRDLKVRRFLLHED